jgi:hypothetical protein
MTKKLKELEDRNTAIDYLNRDIVNIKNELQTLNKLVRDGNGQPSLIQQVTAITTNLQHFQHEVCTQIEDLKTTMSHQHTVAIDRSKSSWQHRTAVWVALISAIASIIMHFAK